MRNESIKNLKPEGQQLILITPEYLERLITNLRDELRSIAVELKKDDDRPLRSKEAGQYLSLSRTQFANWIKTGKIPEKFVHRKAGGPYFFKSELKQCLTVGLHLHCKS